MNLIIGDLLGYKNDPAVVVPIGYDLPRVPKTELAIIGDPRND